MSREEVRLLLAEVEGAEGLHRLQAEFLYGRGCGFDECCSRAYKDTDLGRGQIVVFGKGSKDRVVILPRKLQGARRADCRPQGAARAGWNAARHGFLCQTPWHASIPTRRRNWAGNTASHHGNCRTIPTAATLAGVKPGPGADAATIATGSPNRPFVHELLRRGHATGPDL